MIYFVGAGPGDVDLITVKGLKKLQEADVIIYAGSLVSEEHLQAAKEGCSFYNSAKMHLDEVIQVMKEAVQDEKLVVRLHTGDPTIYGAIQEQMDRLIELAIPFEVIPGVSSFTAAAAALPREFTLPGVSQTVILTRIAGRTQVPEKEKLGELAKHRASMAIFLSVQDMAGVVEELREGYGSWDIPIAVVYRASWPDQRIVRGNLADIVDKVAAAGIRKQAQILVGDFLEGDYQLSKLYDKSFTTEYREGI
ncbi:MAG: precorrin-4 C(11)-methyltransferase [Tissierellia bacterium]|nr:precorrin-4 C(11)-methyltransferase [Tissierellia bacterium]